MANKRARGASSDDRLVVVTNRKARRDYEILDRIEAGLVLKGSEVKSLREGQIQIADAYVRFDQGEAWLQGLHIAPYLLSHESGGHQPERQRKLLLHKRQIEQLSSRVDVDRLTIVALSIYFRQGRAKVELGLGRGRKSYDKRQVIARRDSERDAERELARRSRR